MTKRDRESRRSSPSRTNANWRDDAHDPEDGAVAGRLATRRAHDERAADPGASDRWEHWLCDTRYGGNPAVMRRNLAALEPIRDKVLDRAGIVTGETVLDVGAGDGLVAFAALDRVGPSGTVVFCDISEPLLAHCRAAAADMGRLGQCQFLHDGLPDLGFVPDKSIDVVTIRSVLMYVADKPAAFTHLRRVLRPEGRLSVFEPINRFRHPEPPDVLWGFDVSGLEELADKVKAAYREFLPDDDPMLCFDERDLLAYAERAGFTDLRLDLEIEVNDRHPAAGTDWATFARTAPNPQVPAYGAVLATALDPDEFELLETRLVQHLDDGAGRTRHAVAYLSGRRP